MRHLLASHKSGIIRLKTSNRDLNQDLNDEVTLTLTLTLIEHLNDEVTQAGGQHHIRRGTDGGATVDTDISESISAGRAFVDGVDLAHFLGFVDFVFIFLLCCELLCRALSF